MISTINLFPKLSMPKSKIYQKDRYPVWISREGVVFLHGKQEENSEFHDEELLWRISIPNVEIYETGVKSFKLPPNIIFPIIKVEELEGRILILDFSGQMFSVGDFGKIYVYKNKKNECYLSDFEILFTKDDENNFVEYQMKFVTSNSFCRYPHECKYIINEEENVIPKRNFQEEYDDLKINDFFLKNGRIFLVVDNGVIYCQENEISEKHFVCQLQKICKSNQSKLISCFNSPYDEIFIDEYGNLKIFEDSIKNVLKGLNRNHIKEEQELIDFYVDIDIGNVNVKNDEYCDLSKIEELVLFPLSYYVDYGCSEKNHNETYFNFYATNQSKKNVYKVKFFPYNPSKKTEITSINVHRKDFNLEIERYFSGPMDNGFIWYKKSNSIIFDSFVCDLWIRTHESRKPKKSKDEIIFIDSFQMSVVLIFSSGKVSVINRNVDHSMINITKNMFFIDLKKHAERGFPSRKKKAKCDY